MHELNCLHNYLNLLENDRNYVVFKNPKFEFQGANQRFLNRLKISNHELCRLTDFDLWKSNFAEKYRQDDRTATKLKALKNIVEVHPVDNQINYCLVNKFAIHLKEPVDYTLIIVFEDITRSINLLKKLTLRQMQCVSLIIHGYTGKEIGHVLSISARTVETHLENTKEELGINCMRDLIKNIDDYNRFDLLLDKFIKNYSQLQELLKLK